MPRLIRKRPPRIRTAIAWMIATALWRADICTEAEARAFVFALERENHKGAARLRRG